MPIALLADHTPCKPPCVRILQHDPLSTNKIFVGFIQRVRPCRNHPEGPLYTPDNQHQSV